MEHRLREDAAGGARRWCAVAVWGVIAAALAAAFYKYFRWMWKGWFPAWWDEDLSLRDRFIEGDSYYTHGPLIPIVALVIAWLLVKHTKIAVKPSRKMGLAVVLGSLLVYLLACFAQVFFVRGFALIAILCGIVLFLWGWPAMRRLWFPIALLVFMAPLSHVTIAGTSFRLRMLATRWGVWAANALGVIAERGADMNTVLLAGDKTLLVGDVCSGLRTLISLLAFGAIYAYVCRLRGLWRVGLFAMSVPVALLSNCVRITSIILIAEVWDVKTATGFFHDFSGIIIFVVAFLLMFGLERIVLWAHRAAGRPMDVLPLFHNVRRGPEDKGQWRRMVLAANGGAGVATAVLMVATAGAAWWLNRPAKRMWDRHTLDGAIPRQVRVGDVAYHVTEEAVPRRVQRILATRDILSLRFSAEGRPPLSLWVVFSQDNRMTTHDPGVCITAAGNTILAGRAVDVARVPGHGELPCREIIVRQKQGGMTYDLYTFRAGEGYTSNIWIQQFMILVNGLLDRNASGALIRASSAVTEPGAARARRQSRDLMRVMIPILDRALSN